MIHGEGEVFVPAHLNFGRFVLDRLRAAKPTQLCLRNLTTGEQMTYSELTLYVVRLAAALTELGVGKGDTVAVGGEPTVKFLATGVATVLAGAAYSPIPSRCGSAVLIHKLSLIKPKYVVCSRLLWEEYNGILKSLDFIETIICFEDTEGIRLSVETMVASQKDVDVETFEPADAKGDDLAIVLYSSGTTGMSKAVMLTHLNCLVRSIFQSYGVDSSKVAYIPAMHHGGAYPTFMIYPYLCSGKTIVYSEKNMDLKVIQEYQVDLIPTVPKFVEEFLNANKDEVDLSSLKVIYAAASPLHLAVAQGFKQKYPNIELLIIYGSSEAQIMTQHNLSAAATITIGKAIPGITLKVVDEATREPLGPHQQGEICVRGPSLMKGYLGAKSPYMDDQGFYMTGDLGYYDDNKQFYILGRLNDVINSDMGIKVSPVEVEGILMTHPAVREAAVVGAPGAAWERPAAFVVLRPGASATEAELQDHVASQVSWYMQLRGGVRFMSELPKNELQKVVRKKLKDLLS